MRPLRGSHRVLKLRPHPWEHTSPWHKRSTETFFSNTHRERLSHPEGERFRRASLCLRPSLEESPGCCAWFVLAGCSVDSAPWVTHKCQSTGPDATACNQEKRAALLPVVPILIPAPRLDKLSTICEENQYLFTAMIFNIQTLGQRNVAQW